MIVLAHTWLWVREYPRFTTEVSRRDGRRRSTTPSVQKEGGQIRGQGHGNAHAKHSLTSFLPTLASVSALKRLEGRQPSKQDPAECLTKTVRLC